MRLHESPPTSSYLPPSLQATMLRLLIKLHRDSELWRVIVVKSKRAFVVGPGFALHDHAGRVP